MKPDARELGMQLSLDFDSAQSTVAVATESGLQKPELRTVRMSEKASLSLVYSSVRTADSACSSIRDAMERDRIIRQTISFAQKLSW